MRLKVKVLIGLLKFLSFISLGGLIFSVGVFLMGVFPFSLYRVVNGIILGIISYGSLSLWDWVLLRLGVPKSERYKP